MKYKQFLLMIVRGIVGIIILSCKDFKNFVIKHKIPVLIVLLIVSIAGNVLQFVTRTASHNIDTAKVLRIKDSINNKATSIYDIGYKDGNAYKYQPSKVEVNDN